MSMTRTRMQMIDRIPLFVCFDLHRYWREFVAYLEVEKISITRVIKIEDE